MDMFKKMIVSVSLVAAASVGALLGSAASAQTPATTGTVSASVPGGSYPYHGVITVSLPGSDPSPVGSSAGLF